MAIDVRKTLTDAGYVTVGIGVLAFQQAQVRRRELQQRIGNTGGCLNARATDGKTHLDALARSANEWAQEIGTQVKDRIEPVVGQVVDRVGLRVQTVINRAA